MVVVATVAGLRQHLHDVCAVDGQDPRFTGATPPLRWKIADPMGEVIVEENPGGGQVRVHEAFVGAIINSRPITGS